MRFLAFFATCFLWFCADVATAACDGTDPTQTSTGTQVAYLAGTPDEIRFEFSAEVGCRLLADETAYGVWPINGATQVCVTRMFPDQATIGGRIVNGASVNSKSESGQGWDSAVGYSAALNVQPTVCFDVSGALGDKPQVVLKSRHREDTLTVTNNRCGGNSVRQCLRFLAPLAVFKEDPGNVFRPGFTGHDTYATLRPASAYNPAYWPSVDPVATGLPSYAQAYSAVRWPRANISKGVGTAENMNPEINVGVNRGYPGYVNARFNEAMNRVASHPVGAEEIELRRKSLLSLAQHYIDIEGFQQTGVGQGENVLGADTFGAGGHHLGHLGRYMAGAAALGELPYVKTKLDALFDSPLGRQTFAETGSVQPPTPSGKNVPLFGNVSSAVYGVTLGTVSNGAKTAADPTGRQDCGGNSISGCVCSYMSQLFEQFRGTIGWLQTIPSVRATVPTHAMNVVTFTRRVRDTGAYCNPNTFAGTGPLQHTTYRAAGSVEMFDAYRADFGVPDVVIEDPPVDPPPPVTPPEEEEEFDPAPSTLVLDTSTMTLTTTCAVGEVAHDLRIRKGGTVLATPTTAPGLSVVVYDLLPIREVIAGAASAAQADNVLARCKVGTTLSVAVSLSANFVTAFADYDASQLPEPEPEPEPDPEPPIFALQDDLDAVSAALQALTQALADHQLASDESDAAQLAAVTALAARVEALELALGALVIPEPLSEDQVKAIARQAVKEARYGLRIEAEYDDELVVP